MRVGAELPGGVSPLAMYASWRQADVTINSKPIAFSWLALPGCFLLVTSGALLYSLAANWRGKAFGLMLATAWQWIAVLGTAALLFAMSSSLSRRLGVALWNHLLVAPNLTAFYFSRLSCRSVSRSCADAWRGGKP